MDFVKPRVLDTLKGIKQPMTLPNLVKKVDYEIPRMPMLVRHTTPDAVKAKPSVEKSKIPAPKTKPTYGRIKLEMRS